MTGKPWLEAVARIRALRDEAEYLRSSLRRSGPSPHEAEERATELVAQADAEDERLFYSFHQTT